MTCPDLWQEPMAAKIFMLREQRVFEVVLRSQGRNIVGSRWMYMVKQKEDSGVEKRKARTVAKQFIQVIGKDYKETYVLVARLESVCLVCVIVAVQNLCLWQVDFVLAFLNSNNPFKVYMEQLKGFGKGGEKNCMQKLCKTLYRTIQGAHDWTQNLDIIFERYRYYRSKADSQIHLRVQDNKFILILTQTDDILEILSTL